MDMQMCKVVELMATSLDYLIREQRCGNVFWHRWHYSLNTTKIDFIPEYRFTNTNGEMSRILQRPSWTVL